MIGTRCLRQHLHVAAALALLASIGLSPAAAVSAQAEGRAPAESPDQQVEAVRTAFDLLLDRFVQPLSPATLLDSAWAELAVEADAHHALPPGPAPAFSEDRAADSEIFQSAFLDYVNRLSDVADDFVPAHAAVRGMAGVAQDGHTYFLDQRRYTDYQSWSSGRVSYGGIGAQFKGPGLVVIEVEEGGPAMGAGLRPGDEILRVDDTPVAELLPQKAADLVRGPVGSSVELVVRKRGDSAPISIRIVREQIALEFVVSRQLNDVGYVVLRGFPEPAAIEQVERTIDTFEQQGLRGVILDLRGNVGGRLDLGVRLLSDFLPTGTSLYQVVDRTGSHHMRVTGDAGKFALPMAILVDQRTQSMAEIFAAAMREQAGALIVGHQSAGKVAGGQLFPLGDGSALDVTTFEIQSSVGQTLNGMGVVPDDVVEGDRATTADGRDPVIELAVELLDRAP